MHIYYTFRTNKHIDVLKKSGKTVFVFGNLKQDLESFFKMLSESKVESILGFAEIKGPTRIESEAVNKFGKHKRVCKDGQDSYPMDIPADNTLKISEGYTTSFCNWTMYRISEHIQQHKLKIKHSFVHYNQKDIDQIIQQ